MVGVISTVTYYGKQASTGYKYSYSFALAVAAAGVSLLSALVACAYDDKRYKVMI